jgi:hypothetical protein
MTSGWSLKVSPPLEAAAVVGAGAAAATAASEGADIAGPWGEVAWRDACCRRGMRLGLRRGTGRMRRAEARRVGSGVLRSG